MEGHAVRQLYLLAGVADVNAEAGDEELRKAAERLWHEMVASKTYLTGGIGAHHSDEAFGDPYELPNELSYCETCAAIASVMFSWRMLMITGEARYADLIERTLYNGFLAGLSLDGQKLHLRQPVAGPRGSHRPRQRWRLRAQVLVRLRLLPTERDAGRSPPSSTTSRSAATLRSGCTSTSPAPSRWPSEAARSPSGWRRTIRGKAPGPGGCGVWLRPGYGSSPCGFRSGRIRSR